MSSSDGDLALLSEEALPGGVRLILVTAPAAEARTLVRTLVEERLAACGNVIAGVRSVYRWKGAVEEEEEALLLLKTSRDREADLLRRIPEIHSYDVPEVLVVEVPRGHPPYLAWVIEESGRGPASEG